MALEQLGRHLYKEAARLVERHRRSRLRVPASAAAGENPTVYFVTPDYNLPSGGNRVIYRHVDILNSAGISACVVHQRRGFRCTWFNHDTRVTDVGAALLGPN